MNHSSDSYYNNTFEELSVVGSGGFGTVYKVKHRFNQRLYAIKLIVLKGMCITNLTTIYKVYKEV